MKAVAFSGLTFSYGTAPCVLDNLSAEITAGKVCGIIGASGSGKSTLLKILAGILPNAPIQRISGNMTVLGQPPEITRRAMQVGYVFQDYRLLPFLSVEQNLLWAQKQINRRGAIRRGGPPLQELLEIVGLAEHANVYPRSLSGGMHARAAIARALVGHPKLLLIDEAFSALDVGWRLSLYEELARLRQLLDLSIILISHDIEEICGLADQVLALDPQGVLVGDVDIASIGAASAVHKLRDLILSSHPAVVGRRE